MKRKFLVVLALVLMLSISFLTVACKNTDELVISVAGNVTSLTAGQKVALSAKFNGKDCADAKYEVTAGSQYAAIADGELEISPTAPAGELVSVRATFKDVTSNVLSFSVKSARLPVVTLTASATSLSEGQTATLTVKADNEVVTNANIQIVLGADIATVTNGVLKINDVIAGNSVVALKASVGEAESDLLTVSVIKTSANPVQLTADVLLLRPGQSANLSVKVNGVATVDVTYEITSGSDFATLSGSVLTAKMGTEEGSEVVVRAKYQQSYSDNLIFTIGQAPYILSLSRDSATADKNGVIQTVTPTLMQNGAEVAASRYTITAESSNNSILTAAYDGENGVITFVPKMHGEVTVTVTASIGSEQKTQTCVVKSIVPPTAIEVPSSMKSGIEYGYGNSEELPFVPVVVGSGVCEDYDVTFKLNDQTTTEALYENSKIRFASTGRFTIVVTSKSGSAHETTVEREIIVNDGTNVRTYEEFRAVMNNYDTQQIGKTVSVNLMCDLILDANKYQETYQILDSVINAYGSFDIHGNGYKIDASNIRIVSMEEIDAGKFRTVPTLIDIKPYITRDPATWAVLASTPSDVSIRDLSIYGNINVNTSLQKFVGANSPEQAEQLATKYLSEKKDPRAGAYRFGLHIGGAKAYQNITSSNNETVEVVNQEASSPINSLKIENCLFDGFAVAALDLESIVDGVINDCYFNNAFEYSFNFKNGNVVLNDCVFNTSGVYGIGYSYDKNDALGTVTDNNGVKYDTIMNELTKNGEPNICLTLNNCKNNIVVDGQSVGMLATGLKNTYMGIMGYFAAEGQYKTLRPFMITPYPANGNDAMKFFMYMDCNDASKLTQVIKINNGSATNDYVSLLDIGKSVTPEQAAGKAFLVLPGAAVNQSYGNLYLFFGNCYSAN